MSMSTVDSPVETVTPAAVPFRGTVAAEWTKLSSLRSTRVLVVIGIVGGIGVTALLNWVIIATWDDWPPADRETFEPILTSLVGGILPGVLFPMLGVTAMSAEYSSRMMALTLTVTPRRERVLLAKTVVVAGLTAAWTRPSTSASRSRRWCSPPGC